MSANNYIRIHQPEPLQEFIVEECDADEHNAYHRIGEFGSLEEAIQAANKYMEDPMNEIEYGLQVDI